jgi:hypothetical protein
VVFLVYQSVSSISLSIINTDRYIGFVRLFEDRSNWREDCSLIDSYGQNSMYHFYKHFSNDTDDRHDEN